MEWTEVKIQVPVAQVDTAAAIAQMAVPYGLYIEDYSDLEPMVAQIAHIDLIDDALLQKDKNTAVIHLYLPAEPNSFVNRVEAVSIVTSLLTKDGIPFEVETADLQEEDWATAWKDYYHPIKIGQRVVVCPSWESYRPDAGELVIQLDPGMAFGTGTHHTTMLCVQGLERHVKAGDRVLDLGTGSGILSIAALLLGAKEALGVDIDPVAVGVAEENAAVNGLGDRFTALCGCVPQDAALVERLTQAGPYDVIAANIVADVIIAVAPVLPAFMRPGGVVITSGIIDTRSGEVADALTRAGLQLAATDEAGGWVAMTAVR